MKPYEIKNERKAEYPINNIFLNRWSPRSITYRDFKEEDLFRLFEAARWAPSSFNEQPWRFIYGMHGTKEWNILFSLLVDFNKLWAKDSGALILVLSKNNIKTEKNQINKTHSFDCGSAWMSLALEANLNRLIAHGMSGFDYDKTKKILSIPDGYSIEMMIAVGKQKDISEIDERMQKSEKPNNRLPIKDFISKGEFLGDWK